MSTPSGDSLSKTHLSQGLDRAAYNVYAQAERHLVIPLYEHQQCSEVSGDIHKQDGIVESNRFRRISRNLKSKTNRILHTNDRKQKSLESIPAPALAPPPSKAADDDRMYHEIPEEKGPGFKEVIRQPINTIQSALHGASGAKFAEALDNQVIAHGAEVRIVRAYDEIATAETEEAKDSALGNLEDLKKERQDAFVRWTIDRHVLKVRQIPPCTTVRPNWGDYQVKEERGKGRSQWLEYGHDLLENCGWSLYMRKSELNDKQLLRYYVELYGDQYIDRNPNLPDPSEEAINTSIERLVMTSTPYQVLLMKVRHVYRWENKLETALYLVTYTFLWAMEYLAGTIILTLVGMVIKRRLYPPTLEDIREDIKRSEDVEQTALNLTQLIEQHGSHGWVDALRQDLGPWMLLQIEDLANVLEIWRNFYEWRDPKRTTISLILLIQAWLLVTLVPLSIMVKAGQFCAGFMFFGLFPIASRYPQYRLLASPMKWLFWKVPTDAEWAIARLEVEATHRKQALLEADSDCCLKYNKQSDDAEVSPEDFKERQVNIGGFHCTSQGHHGDLCVTSTNVQFRTAIRGRVLWEVSFEHIAVLQKVGAGQGLLFVEASGEAHRVSGLKSRDEVFTQIIGYSGLRWQVSG